MKSFFTSREDEKLAEMMEVVDWQLKNRPGDTTDYINFLLGKNTSEVDTEFKGALSYIESEITKKDTDFSLSSQVDEGRPVWDYSELYEDDIFWSELKERLVAKAAALSLEGTNKLELLPEVKTMLEEDKEISYGPDMDLPEFILPEQW